MIILAAIPNQLDQIRMAKLAKEIDLGEPFTVALKALLVENLNGNGKGFEANSDVLINVALVNGTKAALAENVVRAEALGDGLQLE